jgi:hypothetical protein
MSNFERLLSWLRPQNAIEFSGVLPGQKRGNVPIKAEGQDFLGRFREIISDPINVLIERHPLSGCIEQGNVILHNGIRVPYSGPQSYYGRFSEILVLNRGVHEPLEEFCFQEVLKLLDGTPIMLELGAYWGHYSMWCQSVHSGATTYLVEPEPAHLNIAKRNFERNNLQGHFFQALVGNNAFQVDAFLDKNKISKLSILHSDIQGFELEMLDGARRSFEDKRVDYCFVSTHSDELHQSCMQQLKEFGYLIEAEANFSTMSTSFDGFVLASSPTATRVFSKASFAGRTDLVKMKPDEIARLVGNYSVISKNPNNINRN